MGKLRLLVPLSERLWIFPSDFAKMTDVRYIPPSRALGRTLVATVPWPAAITMVMSLSENGDFAQDVRLFSISLRLRSLALLPCALSTEYTSVREI